MAWLKNFLNHERYTAIGLILSGLLIVWISACESKVQSIRFPERRYSRMQLQAELDSILAEYDFKTLRLDQKDQIKKIVFDNLVLVSRGGTFNPLALIPLGIGILGAGATVDRVRAVKKNKKSTASA